MNPYTERFEQLSDKEIMNMVSCIEEYSTEAQEAAWNEFYKRGLSKEELEVNKEKIIAGKKTAFDRWMDKAQKEYLFSTALPDSIRLFNGICILVMVCFLYINVPGIYHFWRYVFDPETRVDYYLLKSTVLYIGLFILPLLSIYLFWTRYWLGWYLFVIFTILHSYGIISRTVNEYIVYKEYFVDFSSSEPDSPFRNAYLYITLFAVIGLVVYACKEEVRKWFEVSKMAASYTVGVMCFLVLVIVYFAYQNALYL